MFNDKNIGVTLKLTIFTKHVDQNISENAFLTVKTDVNYKKIRKFGFFDAAVFPSIWSEPFGCYGRIYRRRIAYLSQWKGW